MSIKVNINADIPLELFSAIRHGGLDNLKAHELGHISSIATQALVEGSRITQPTSPLPADFPAIVNKLKEKVKLMVNVPEPKKPQPIIEEWMYVRVHEWFLADALEVHKLAALQPYCDNLLYDCTLIAEIGLHYLEGELRAMKFLPPEKANARLPTFQREIHKFLHESTEFLNRMSRFFSRQLRRASKKARVEVRNYAGKHEDDEVYSITKKLSDPRLERRIRPIFESLKDAEDTALVALLDHTLVVHKAQIAGHLLADRVLSLSWQSRGGPHNLICANNIATFSVRRHARKDTAHWPRRRDVISIHTI